eukprot:TRINITY_DN32120_c0_g1_i1.p1 TRINITY_DN32120_c0_g1~~TRINITY_DN32120_c0_g1_i1.p1  ORF type:complete len:474 (+),score=74.83 TRINITY_DN32120_c0_g1_i1:161-1582(+)
MPWNGEDEDSAAEFFLGGSRLLQGGGSSSSSTPTPSELRRSRNDSSLSSSFDYGFHFSCVSSYSRSSRHLPVHPSRVSRQNAQHRRWGGSLVASVSLLAAVLTGSSLSAVSKGSEPMTVLHSGDVVDDSLREALREVKWPSSIAAGEALVLPWRKKKKQKLRKEEAGEQNEPQKIGLLDVQFLELQVENSSLRFAKLLVPSMPQVAKWWTESAGIHVSYRLERTLTSNPRIHVHIQGPHVPLVVGHYEAEGVHATIELPERILMEACQLGQVRVNADVPGLAGLGPLQALLVVCQVKPTSQMPHWSSVGVHDLMPPGGNPLRWILLPWMLLLMPFIVGSQMGPMALLGGAALTLASIACLSFTIAILIVIVQRHCLHVARRWRRLWRLRSLARRPRSVGDVFGEGAPCCICLGDCDRDDGALIALLPCRHALHAECYHSWVRADAYPSHDLICPVCRRRAEAIGKLDQTELES